MRKLTLLISAFVLMLSLCCSVFATEVPNEESNVNTEPVIISETPATEAQAVDPSTCLHNYPKPQPADAESHVHTCTLCGNTTSYPHIWNSGIPVTSPTCCSAGETRYGCQECGYQYSETVPATGVHEYKNGKKIDDSSHILTCIGCNEQITEAHVWNNGTNTQNPNCIREGTMIYNCKKCEAYRQETLPITTTHNYGAWNGNEVTHMRSCADCGKTESGSHSWYGGTVVLAPTCKEVGVMGYLCTGCDMVLLEEIPIRSDHIYDNDCDDSCNSCGLKRNTSHKYATTYTKSSTGHWYACTVCGDKKDTSPHIPGPAATATTDQTCNACGYVIRSRQNHTHSYQSKWTSNAEGHWYACSGCTIQKDFKAHSYDNGCDTDCNVCGYINKTAHSYDGTWQTDEKGHWAICTVCNVESTHTAHIPGPEADENNPQTCTTCSYILTPVQEHKHSGGDTWLNDSDKHWKLCECGEITDEAAHIWDEGTSKVDSTVIYTCKDCKLTRTEETLMTTSLTEDASTEETSTDETSSEAVSEPSIIEDHQNHSALISVVFGVIVIALIGAVIALVLILKPKKRGRFSK